MITLLEKNEEQVEITKFNVDIQKVIKKLPEEEQYWIKQYADKGYQLRNKTSGSQGEGKAQIDDFRPQKGYRDGLAQGYKNAVREIKGIIDKHLIVSLKPEKANNKVPIRQYEKFNEILNGGGNDD